MFDYDFDSDEEWEEEEPGESVSSASEVHIIHLQYMMVYIYTLHHGVENINGGAWGWWVGGVKDGRG